MTGKLDSRKVWLGGAALLAVIVVAASWFLLISPRLSDSAALRDQAAATDQQNSQSQSDNDRLAQKYVHLAVLQQKLYRAMQAVPAVGALPTFTKETYRTARESGVQIESLTIGVPSAYDPTGTAAAPTTESSSAPSDAATPATTDPAAATSQQYQYPITITSKGSYTRLAAYAKSLQHGARDVLVSSAAIASNTLTVQALIFTAPMTPAQLKQTRELLTPAS